MVRDKAIIEIVYKTQHGKTLSTEEQRDYFEASERLIQSLSFFRRRNFDEGWAYRPPNLRVTFEELDERRSE